MQPPYGSWPSSGHKEEQRQCPGSTPSRRDESGGQQRAYSYTDSYFQPVQYHRGGARHTSPVATSLTSSLSGAMGGDILMPSSSPPSVTASPSGMAWTPPPTSALPEGYPAVSSETSALGTYLGTPPPGSAQSSYVYSSYGTHRYGSSSPESAHTLPSGVPSAGYADQQLVYSQSPPRQSTLHSVASSMQGVMPMAMTPAPTSSPVSASCTSRPTADRLGTEVQLLQNKVRELELINKSSRERIRELEHEVAHTNYTGPATSPMDGLPSPVPSSLPVSRAFQVDWQARTDARVKLFCSLNRAGNALCAWHDSRRERRQWPPRNAPPGHLNCGCTYEQALFEESLARHGVGSYHPGESVRMDPALRNPLLKLLQERYGYHDGDFERDPVTGNWMQGEGAACWEARAASGASAVRRQHRSDNSS